MTILKTLTAKSRENKITRWQSYSKTIYKHIIKILLIVDESSTVNFWTREIENHIELLQDNNKKFNNQKFYDDVYQRVKVTDTQLMKYVEQAVNDYLSSEDNLKHIAFLRQCKKKDLLKTTDTMMQWAINSALKRTQLSKSTTFKNTYLTFHSSYPLWQIVRTSRLNKIII